MQTKTETKLVLNILSISNFHPDTLSCDAKEESSGCNKSFWVLQSKQILII